jgi:hypothetical protein
MSDLTTNSGEIDIKNLTFREKRIYLEGMRSLINKIKTYTQSKNNIHYILNDELKFINELELRLLKK